MKVTWTPDGNPLWSKKDEDALQRWADKIQSDIDKNAINILLNEVWIRELKSMYHERDKSKGIKRMMIQDRIDEHKKGVKIQ